MNIFLTIASTLLILTEIIYANSCEKQNFSVKIKKEISISEALDSLADSCGLNVVVRDAMAKDRLNKKLYYINLKNSTLYNFLNLLLSDNGLVYKLKKDKLEISYLTTRTFKINYIASSRVSSSNANINIASTSIDYKGTSSTSGAKITSDDKFDFWSKLKGEIHRVLVISGDGSTHFTKKNGVWIDNRGHSWQFNPLEPVVDEEAGLITVSGTPMQIKRVGQYIRALSKQIKSQVLIDVKILTVTLNNDKRTGINWSQLYDMQNFTISTLSMNQKNISTWKSFGGKITDTKFKEGARPRNAALFDIRGTRTIDDLIKFLKTQGSVKTLSNPKVMTLNNQPALISVGKEIFYKTTSTSSTKDGKETISSKIDSIFAGVLLDIMPEIDKHGMITLRINPSITETDAPISKEGARTMPPDLIRRQLSTVIKVKNGKHAILGGLISTATSSVKSKIPLLGDIPLLGEAFKRERMISKTEELVIIITPKITNGEGYMSLKKLGYRSIIK